MAQLLSFRSLACPAVFASGVWVLSTKTVHRFVLDSWPTLLSDDTWESLRELCVGFSVLVGFPPEVDNSRNELDMSAEEIMEELFIEASRRRSTYDIIGGNVILLVLMLPTLLAAYYLVSSLCRGLRTAVIVPVSSRLRKQGLMEPLAYTAAFVLCIFGMRVTPVRGMASGFAVGINTIAVLMFTPLWHYTASLHRTFKVERPKSAAVTEAEQRAQLSDYRRALLERRLHVTATGHALQAVVALPVALALSSNLISFFALAAGTAAVAFELFLPQYGEGSVSQQAENLLEVCAKVSLHLSVAAVGLRAVGGAAWLTPFAVGICCFGHVLYFACVVALSAGSWPRAARDRDEDQYRYRQRRVIFSVFGAVVFGYGLGIEALKSSAILFTLVWLLIRESEATSFKSVPKLGGALVFLCCTAGNLGQVAALFDASGLYT